MQYPSPGSERIDAILGLRVARNDIFYISISSDDLGELDLVCLNGCPESRRTQIASPYGNFAAPRQFSTSKHHFVYVAGTYAVTSHGSAALHMPGAFP
jgi:hypothetical protein